MRLICGVFLAILLISMFIFEYKKTKDLFSPICMFSFFQFIRYVINIIVQEEEWSITFNDDNMLIVTLMELLFVLSVLLSYKISNKYFVKKTAIDQNKYDAIASTSVIQIAFLYGIGLAAKIYLIIQSGGIAFILKNTGEAYIGLSSGNGYINSLIYVAYISFFMMLERYRQYKRKKQMIILVCMIVVYCFTDLIYSHRSTMLTIVIVIIFGVNYSLKRIRISNFLKPRYIFVFIICCIIFVEMPKYRSQGTYGTESTTRSLGESVDQIVDRLSMVGRDTFVYEHFNTDNYWLGRSYLNFLMAPIPSSIYNDKPAVEDGMYLTHLIYGYNIEPNTSVSRMYFKSAIPFSTQGLMYANFGILGVILGGFIIGIIYSRTYRKTLLKTNIYTIAWYRVIIVEFSLTTSVFVSSLLQYIYIKIIYFINKKKYQRGDS